jgi:hypothetical protein
MVQAFQRRKLRVVDESRSGRRSTGVTDVNIDKAEQLLKEDTRLTLRESQFKGSCSEKETGVLDETVVIGLYFNQQCPLKFKLTFDGNEFKKLLFCFIQYRRYVSCMTILSTQWLILRNKKFTLLWNRW